MRMAVGSIKMQPPFESPALAAAATADGAPRRSPSSREADGEQPAAPQRPRLRDLPALLRSGLTLRRKRSAAGARVSASLGRQGHRAPHVGPAPTLGRLESGWEIGEAVEAWRGSLVPERAKEEPRAPGSLGALLWLAMLLPLAPEKPHVFGTRGHLG